MNIVERIKGIILKPKEEWIKIKGESTPVMTLFTQYVLPLAAIPAIAKFIGSIISRFGIVNSLLSAVVFYVLNVASLYISGLIINALAPSFTSKQNLENAMKLVVYSMTPMWVAGVLYILPVLGILAGLASLYSLYILYLGFNNPMLETPQDKVVPYLIVSIVITAVLVSLSFYIVTMMFAVSAVTRLSIPGY